MRVTAHDGHSRKRKTLLRTYDVDDTIVLRHHAVVGKTKFSGILRQCVNLLLGYRVLDGFVLIVGRSVMVGHTVDMVGTEALESSLPHTSECLWRRHLVAIETVDVKLCGTVFYLLNDVLVPDFIK